jgi:hypothetical protein
MRDRSTRKEHGEMTENPDDPQYIECRLVVIDAQSMRILTSGGPAGALLPRASIRVDMRVAQALTEAIEQRYGLSTIQLTLLPQAAAKSHCTIHEIMGSRGALSGSLPFVSLDEIAPTEFFGDERATVVEIMSGRTSGLGRFAQLGWIDKLLDKAGIHLDRSSSPMIRQLNQGNDFSLLSLTDVKGRKVWFKAVGEPNAREYPLTLELARRFPAYLPKVLVTIPEWNGWVAENVEGVPLNEATSMHHYKQALTALAIMQQEMAGSIPSLLGLGAKDWTCARIASLSEPFFQESRLAMQAQITAKPKPLTNSELDQLKTAIESALCEFAHPDIPETLLHGDIGHGNIIGTPKGPVFLDWAETCIGHPFLSAEHLLADLVRSHPGLAQEGSRLRLTYSDLWSEYVTPRALATVAALAPAVAAFVYAVMAWDACAQRQEPTRAWPLLRSMLRRTKLELEHASDVAA